MAAHSPRPLRILFVTPLYPPDYEGGVEINCQKIARGLRSRGHHVDVVTSQWRPEFKGERTDDPGVHRILTYALPHQRRATRWGNRLETFFSLIRASKVVDLNLPRLRQHLETHPYDLVYVFGAFQISAGTLLAAQERGIPILWNVSQTYLAELWAPKRSYRMVLQTFARDAYATERAVRFDYSISVSKFIENFLRERGLSAARKAFVVHRGIEFPLMKDVERQRTQPPEFLIPVRITAEKGLDSVVEAAKILHDTEPDRAWQVVVAGKPGSGDHAYAERLHAKIADHRLQTRFSFPGLIPREPLMQRMREATACILPTLDMEPFSNVVIESLACGTPLILTAVGGGKEAITDGHDALVFPQEDAPALARHMHALLTDKALGLRLAAEGIKTIEDRFTFAKILDQTEEVLRAVLADAGKAHP